MESSNTELPNAKGICPARHSFRGRPGKHIDCKHAGSLDSASGTIRIPERKSKNLDEFACLRLPRPSACRQRFRETESKSAVKNMFRGSTEQVFQLYPELALLLLEKLSGFF